MKPRLAAALQGMAAQTACRRRAAQLGPQHGRRPHVQLPMGFFSVPSPNPG